MANDTSKQVLANLIQANEIIVTISRSGYGDTELEEFFVAEALAAQERVQEIKEKLNEVFGIDYDSPDAKNNIIKEGNEVEVLVDHMEGMKGGTAVINGYSLPANVSDITMTDGMKMNEHKWLTNDEVKLI
jgi:predicted RNA-binding protein with EMAP domain